MSRLQEKLFGETCCRRKLTSILATAVAPDKADEEQKEQKEENDTEQYDEPAGTSKTLRDRLCSKTETSPHIHY